MRIRNTLGVLAAFSGFALSGCSGEAGGGITAPHDGPWLVGVTTSVTVTCPTPIKPGQGGPCTAYGRDVDGQFTSSSATWSSSNTSRATVSASGVVTGVATGTATISGVVDGITGTKVVAVTPDIYIDGPPSVRSNQVCSFFAEVTAGTAPFTYGWTSNNGIYDYGYTFNEPWTWTGHSSSNFTLYLTVTDASGQSTTVTKYVSISAGAPSVCII